MTLLQARTVEDIQAIVRARADARRAAGASAAADPLQAVAAGSKTALSGAASEARPLRAVAGRSKTALSGAGAGAEASATASAAGTVDLIDVSGLAGIIDYQPAECTFTAWAG